ncbi:CDP-diacylglycerol--glycerol-3-phosphate 3-phosphatidyltransferase [Starmerella bacillaris]|uniref:CDP-diacylglycerol--glycerol-3-phosphate 3-phosphatidyltransferase n=1 Tax=Starmerella bacillaris TaxID=1247836 RepID=A0AAV5RFX1_STABA|nr:CDP-diacylglycerol--glycerol-3-phosphate 3-phosphatidyltransferase [Starmerella bacillaris]
MVRPFRSLNLAELAPRFVVPQNKISVFTDPSDFYEHLCTRIPQAKSRIFLASLYMGVNPENKRIISLLDTALDTNKDLKVDILMDALRSTRESPHPCTASMLAPLSAKYPTQVRISLYRTPKLPRVLQHVIPKRVIEGAGLQHMKLYGFDNEILLSGANLSTEYYTQRQDRYISFDNKKLCDYYHEIFSAVSGLSLQLTASKNDRGFNLHTNENESSFLKKLKALVAPYSQTSTNNLISDSNSDSNSNSDSGIQESSHESSSQANSQEMAEVYPVCQFTPLGIGNEVQAIKQMAMEAQSSSCKSMFTAGYFNVYPELADVLKRANDGTVVVASPQANGFYKSRGISSKIPRMYALSARRFAIQAGDHVSMREWQRGVVNTPGGWSYHAKGFYLLQQQALATYIGSSNFTYRSFKHDLECGAVVIVRNSESSLGEQLEREMSNIKKYTREVTSEQLCPDVTLRELMLFKMLRKRL